VVLSALRKEVVDMRTNILIGIAIIGLLSMTSVSLAIEGIWTRKADMPTARLGLTTSTVDGKIYAIGGYPRAATSRLRTVEEYDPATDTWTTKADMPTARTAHASSVVNGKVYVIGGMSAAFNPGLSTVEEYNPSTNTWAIKAPMPTGRLGLSTSAVDGKIYAIGGSKNVWSDVQGVVEEYDPATNTWTRKADMPTARCTLSTSAVNGKIYAIGGALVNRTFIATVEAYDIETNTWTTKADMPTPRGLLTTAVVGGKIFAIGGGTTTTGFSAVEVYDPATDIWTSESDMPVTRAFLSPGAGVVDDKIYVIGGSESGASSHPGLNTVYEYDPFPLVVDFNGDGVVDLDDLVIMIECYGTDEPLCDIAPPPEGDGIVNRLDLELFLSYWEQENCSKEVYVDEEDANSQVTLELNQILVVTLESNPSTGYQWEAVEDPNSILEQIGEAEFKSSYEGAEPIVGAGGWEIFRFKAVSAGQMTLQMVYRRYWETDVEPAKTFSIDVVVN
jgi:predicted secreted protein/N-acetylneuraminic acid mutarotase